MTSITIGGKTVYGTQGICEAFGVNRNTVANWRALTDFPAPVGTLGGSDVWDADQVGEWHHARYVVPRQKAIASYDYHGSITQAARDADVEWMTAKRWLEQAGVLDDA